MKRIVVILLVVLGVVMLLGILIPAIYRARAGQDLARCQDHLRQVGAVGLHHPTVPNERVPKKGLDWLPAATVVNPDLPVESRLSWYVLILSAVHEGVEDVPNLPKRQQPLDALIKSIDTSAGWDAESNRSASQRRLTVALCPAVAPKVPAEQASLTQYVAIGGIGQDTPSIELEKAGKRAGVLRYDFKTPKQFIADHDGLSNSLMLAETNSHLGPWLQGGPSTLRTLDPANSPYLGVGRPWGGCHQGRGNFAMADGSVRVITDRINPGIFRAFFTIAGNELDDEWTGP